MSISIQASYGEVIDKITILQIKLDHFKNQPDKYERVEHEWRLLTDSIKITTAWNQPIVQNLKDQLIQVNLDLWDIEDALRAKERLNAFDDEFVSLARNVYVINDRRCSLKNKINDCMDSSIHEVKSHTTVHASGPSSNPIPLQTGLLIPHLGLGDHLVLNGLVRYLLSTLYAKLKIFCYSHNVEAVRFMFRDLGESRIHLIDVPSTDELRSALFKACLTRKIKNLIPGCEHDTPIYVGIYQTPSFDTEDVFWKSFYRGRGLDTRIMRDYFKVLRHPLREDRLYASFIEHIKTPRYIVIHEDPERGYALDRAKIPNPNQLPLINISKGAFPVESKMLFDYGKIIEQAEAFHGFDSSIAWMVELCHLRVPKKYLHVYVRMGKGYTDKAYERGHQWIEVS